MYSQDSCLETKAIDVMCVSCDDPMGWDDRNGNDEEGTDAPCYVEAS